jgi:hypothetical protein
MNAIAEKKAGQLREAAVDGRTTRTSRGPRTEPTTRVAWSGGLSEEELMRPGGILLSMLIQRANELGHQLGDMAKELGVTYGYISQLRTGLRKTHQISDAFATSCALYLGAPRMTVLLASGRVKPEDVFPDPNELLNTLPRAIQFIRHDTEFGPLMPPDMLNADPQLQYFVVTMYEKATGRVLLPGRENPASLGEQITNFNAYRARMLEQIEAGRAKNTLSDDSED